MSLKRLESHGVIHDKNKGKPYSKKRSQPDQSQTASLNFAFKIILNTLESYLERNKVLNALAGFPDQFHTWGSNQKFESLDTISRKKKTKRFILKLKTMEHLIRDFRIYRGYQTRQLEDLLEVAIKTQMAINSDQENQILSQRCNESINGILELLSFDGYLPACTIRDIFKIIQDKNYWKMKEDCADLIEKLCERSRDKVNCLLYILENMHVDYEYLAESASILQTLIAGYMPQSQGNGINQLLEGCCQLLAECNPKRIDEKLCLQSCITTLESVGDNQTLPFIARQTVRVSIGPYRSDIADLLYELCKERDISHYANLVGPLILMIDDRDADVVIRGYQIFTQVLSPPIACLYRMHSRDNFLSYADKISQENQTTCPSEMLAQVKNSIKQIILTMLICYIRHAIYPKTLEALLIFNCTLIIEVKETSLLPRITSFLLNLQEAALSILPIKSMRQSFIQWAVLHLFLLVADVYSISSLKDYTREVIAQRNKLSPFLLYPIRPSSLNSIPSVCLMEKQQVKTIVQNWNQLVAPTRTLHELTYSSTLSLLSAWDDFDFEL